ncbi:MAG: hypothetical protein K2O92_01545, partial [Lachnospiraceae bacterium]|nr:hypothetical protein [Lachnospiraceae bacterium]
YMMAGGTTFPYMGGRGDLVLGGYGNITSYDFGGAPVGETGEINKDKYYWIKGFIRFAKEFSHIIAESDGREDIKIISGGEDIAVLDKESSFLDVSAVKAYENFTVYQEGNKDGRFFFIRNAEAEDKTLSIEIPEELNGSKYMVKATVLADQTRMLPVAFKITENVRVNYSLSEIWMTQKYNNATAVIMYGREETDGELCLNVPADKVTIISGDARKYSAEGKNTILYYKHGSIVIIKAEDVIFFILGEEMTGHVDTLKDGILLHNVYYLEDIVQDNNKVNLKLQIKENSGTKIMYYPLNGRKIKEALLDNTKVTVKECKCGIQEISFETASFADRPEAEWTSGWKYCADSMETKENFDDSGWTELPEPVSLEEAGMFKHGYYWFRSSFETDREIKEAYLSFKHNDTDRYLVYINGSLVFRSRNKSINNHNITTALHKGVNTIAVLYANEFHNKSHPHEGAIVKYSGIINPFTIKGSYSDGSGIDINISSFKVKYQLDGYNNGYHTTGYDDSGWQEAPEARKFVAGREMGHVIWFRRHFTYNPADGYTAPLY